MIVSDGGITPITAGHDLRPTSGTPQGAAQDGDFVAQHEKLDVLGGGRAAHQ
jgi:hypothetical protein